MDLSEREELFLANLELLGSVKAAGQATGIAHSTALGYQKKLKDVIIERARDHLAGAALKAAQTAVELMDADASTEQGVLRLKAAEGLMDRTGLTRHTSVEVNVESENGVFILPAKGAPTADPKGEEEEDLG